MKVESIKIKNFKAIANENLEVKGNNVYVLGKNGVGKSSFIDSIFKIISNKDLPSKLTKEGEKNGFIEIDLGEIKVKATFNEKNEKVSLSIESKDGAQYKSPRSMLDELAGVVDFDITSFFALSPKKQVEYIKNLAGIDFTDLDDSYEEIFKERTFVNRKVKELEAQVQPYDKKKLETKDLSDLQQKLEKANLLNTKIKDISDRSRERLEKIKQVEEQLIELKKTQELAKQWLSENAEINTDLLKNEFNQAIEYNKEVQENIKNKDLNERLRAELETQEHLNRKLSEIETTKRTAISEAKLPVPGLTFDDNQLFLNGLPFEKSQINTAQQIITALQINLALLKDIKIARFDGSLLDNENIKLVEDWAKENDLQLFVEFVDRNTESLTIEIKE